jgi:hypothetical protein
MLNRWPDGLSSRREVPSAGRRPRSVETRNPASRCDRQQQRVTTPLSRERGFLISQLPWISEPHSARKLYDAVQPRDRVWASG